MTKQPMPHSRVLAITTRSATSTDPRKGRRASNVCLRWVDSCRASTWVDSEYHAMRRKAVFAAYHYTHKYFRNSRAKATGA